MRPPALAKDGPPITMKLHYGFPHGNVRFKCPCKNLGVASARCIMRLHPGSSSSWRGLKWMMDAELSSRASKVLPVVKVECLIKGNPYPNPFTVFLLPEPFSSLHGSCLQRTLYPQGRRVNVLLHGKIYFSMKDAMLSLSAAGTSPRCLCSAGQFLIPGDSPDPGVSAIDSSTALFVLEVVSPVLAWLSMTPFILTSGSRALNPRTMAAALLTRLLEFIISTT